MVLQKVFEGDQEHESHIGGTRALTWSFEPNYQPVESSLHPVGLSGPNPEAAYKCPEPGTINSTGSIIGDQVPISHLPNLQLIASIDVIA